MPGPRIAMVGAGSVVFTRTLAMDILSLPELKDSHIALHDIAGKSLGVPIERSTTPPGSFSASARRSSRRSYG